MQTIAKIRENPDDYPLTNVRWSYGVAFFILPPALAGYTEGGLRMALGGAAVGLGFTVFASLLWYSGDKYEESLPARVTYAAVLTSIVCLLLVFVGLMLMVAADALSHVVTLPLLAGGGVLSVFGIIFYLLSP